MSEGVEEVTQKIQRRRELEGTDKILKNLTKRYKN